MTEDVLLFGGKGPVDLHDDTWRWDGATWTQVEDIGPPARAEHAIASDSARSRVVLFGGRSGSGPVADTWEWDGVAWTQVADTGPSARFRHALAYDSARSRVVLFGGEDASGLRGDTWEWDGNDWTQVADTGPGPRGGHAMCFEIPASRTVLFGGSSGSDTWTWNGIEWTEINDVGPEPRQGTGLVFAGITTVLFGGTDPASGVLFGGTWQLDGTDWTERQDIGPAGRQGYAMAYDETRKQVVLFGGSAAPSVIANAADLFSDTWELRPPGASAQIRVTPTFIDHSSAPFGQETTVYVTVEYLTDSTLGAQASVMPGPHGEFSVKSNSCGGPHQTGDTCQIMVSFWPPYYGYTSACRLTIVTPDNNKTYGVDIYINNN
ncbi:MAG: kelch repeat-containing protein [Acidimicrobiia bacterium]